tara:strand:- start:548 stop:1003 length:456 start_codon:yes stop_codon:yes gene_type:complete
MINYFDNKRNNNQFAPMNNNSVTMNNGNAYAVEGFASTPTPRNTSAPKEKDITKNNDYLNSIANKIKKSNENVNRNVNVNGNDNKNELEKNMSVAVKNSKLNTTNNNVPSFYSLSMEQLGNLKKQTRNYGVLGLVFFDEKTDTLRIESTKA